MHHWTRDINGNAKCHEEYPVRGRAFGFDEASLDRGWPIIDNQHQARSVRKAEVQRRDLLKEKIKLDNERRLGMSEAEDPGEIETESEESVEEVPSGESGRKNGRSGGKIGV